MINRIEEVIISCILHFFLSLQVLNHHPFILVNKLYWLINKREHVESAEVGVVSMCGGQKKSRCWFLYCQRGKSPEERGRERERGEYLCVCIILSSHIIHPCASRKTIQMRGAFQLPLPVHTFSMSIQDQMPGLMKDGRQPREVNQTADDKDQSQWNVGSWYKSC